MPSWPAAHSPSSLLRRASALNLSSSSSANFRSKASSRLSNVVMALGSNPLLNRRPPSLRPARGTPRYWGRIAKTTGPLPLGKRVKLGPTEPDRLCLKGQSDRLPVGLVLVLFPVPGLHGSSVVG